MAVKQTQTQTNARTGLTISGKARHGERSKSFDTHRNAPLKVYTDISKRKGVIGVGMVVKNHNGKILRRDWFQLKGEHTTNEAEAKAIRKAMMDIHADHVKFFTDCQEVATVLQADVSLPIRKFEYVTLNCVDRDENFAANLLARKANPHVRV